MTLHSYLYVYTLSSTLGDKLHMLSFIWYLRLAWAHYKYLLNGMAMVQYAWATVDRHEMSLTIFQILWLLVTPCSVVFSSLFEKVNKYLLSTSLWGTHSFEERLWNSNYEPKSRILPSASVNAKQAAELEAVQIWLQTDIPLGPATRKPCSQLCSFCFPGASCLALTHSVWWDEKAWFMLCDDTQGASVPMPLLELHSGKPQSLASHPFITV